jgi:hypothetical protein
MAEKVYRGASQGMKCTNPACPTVARTGAANGKKPARGVAGRKTATTKK